METDMWILATSSSLADADLPWISPIAIAVAVLLIITAAYFVVKAHIDKKLTKEREAMIRSQQEQELKTAQNKIRFLTNVSQQLFTPLTLIYAPVNELLRRTRDSRDPVPTHDAYCLSEIERNSLRLIRLIEQQLDYEKLDQGQLTLQIGPSDIIPRIRNVINGFNRISGEKNIDIHLDCPYDSLVLPVDSDKLEKIAANLIGHTLRNIRPNATVWIELRVTVEPDSIFGLEGIHDKYLQINVIDNGSLLSEENLSHLFERYRRADKEEIQNEFGIDLHYVKKLTELHGGRVIARKGATFYAVSMSVCHICKCILSGIDTTMTVSTMMHGEYGIDDVCLSTLNIVGRNGVRGKVNVPLSDDEVAKLRLSAETLKDVIKNLDI